MSAAMTAEMSGGGGIRTRGALARTPVFKTGAFDHSATPPGSCDAILALDSRRAPGRGGRVAEGTRLLSEYGVHTPSRVRIPPSPSSHGYGVSARSGCRACRPRG